MFCLIYFPNSGDKKPNPESPNDSHIQPCVLEISKSRESLLKTMEDKSIQQCIDEVGRKNFVNTLDTKDLSIEYPIYPTLTLSRLAENMIQVYRMEKKQVVVKGYLYNSTNEVVESSLHGTYYVVSVDHWKYDDLPRRPEEEKHKILKPFESKGSQTMVQNYDKVLLELIQSIQSRRI